MFSFRSIFLMLLFVPGLAFASSTSCLEATLKAKPDLNEIIKKTEIDIKDLKKTGEEYFNDIYNRFESSTKKSLNSHNLGNYDQGLNFAAESLVLHKFSEPWNHLPFLAIASSRSGINLTKLGHLDVSLKCHSLAYQLLSEVVKENKQYESHLAWEAINIGNLYKKLGDNEEAFNFLKEAKSKFRTLSSKNTKKFTPSYLNALAEESSLHLENNEIAAAELLMEEYFRMIDISNKSYPAYQAFAREIFARIFIELNKLTEAKEQIKIAKDLLELLPDNYYLHPLLDLSQSKIQELNGNLKYALKFNLRALNSIEESKKNLNYKLDSFSKLEPEVERMYAHYFSLIHRSYKETSSENLLEDSLVSLQSFNLKSFRQKINLLINEEDNFINKKDVETGIELLEKTEECNKLNEELRAYSENRIGAKYDDAGLVSKRKKINLCSIEVANIKAKKYSNKKVKDFIYPVTSNLKNIKKSLQDDEALIAFYFNSTDSFVWLITNKSTKLHKVQTSFKTLTSLRNKLRNTLSLDESSQRLVSFDKNSSFDLYNALLMPMEADLIDINSLIILKNDFFTRLPLSVLISDLNDRGEPDWLFQRYDINNVHSISELINRSESLPLGNFYGFGDPLPKDNLEVLNNAELELKSLSQGFVSPWKNVFLRENATKNKLASIAYNNGILAFATHAITPFQLENISEPSLLLNEWLGAKEIAFKLNINASVVLLSACETAWSSARNKEPILDLPTAFILSGSQTVVVTNWSIEDQATKDIMVEAADYIYKNPNEANLFNKALRQGMNNYIIENKNKDYAGISRSHPFFWAPFELIGAPN